MRLFLGLLGTLSLGLSTSSAIAIPKAPSFDAFTSPAWGFVAHQPAEHVVVSVAARSLLFDQSFDAHSFRPFPSPRRMPAVIAASAEELPTQQKPVVVTSAPQTIARLVAASVQVEAPATKAANWAFNKPLSQAPKAIATISSPPAIASSAPIVPVTKSQLRSQKILSTLDSQDLDARLAKVFVFDEESLVLGQPRPVAGATLTWIGPNSQLTTSTNSHGVARSPYPLTQSSRFLIKAPGFLPALGYASLGQVAHVALVSEKSLGTIIKSLSLETVEGRTLVVGKVIDSLDRPIEGVTVDLSADQDTLSYYSVGTFGVFHPQAKKTGKNGDFLVSTRLGGFQYLMPTLQNEGGSVEWPATLLDLTSLPKVVTTTIVQPKETHLQTQVVDSMSFEKPPVGIQLTVGGQRGIHIPDGEGFVEMDALGRRTSPDLVEITAQGYLKTWLTTLADPKLAPTSVSLFTSTQISQIFENTSTSPSLANGIVFGQLRPELYAQPVEIRVYDASGHLNRTAKIHYFDHENILRDQKKATDATHQTFVVTDIGTGEWHLVAIDPKENRGLGVQVVRTMENVVSSVQF